MVRGVLEQQQTITAQQMMQVAWAHLKELTEKDRNRGRRKFSDGEFRTAVVTYPTVAPPIVRKEVKELVQQLGIDDVQIAYDEAVSVAIFFLWREFGGNLSIGIESFKTRCRYNGNKWSQNVLILDIGGGTTDVAVLSMGDIVTSESVKAAGNAFDQDILAYIKKQPPLGGC